jgi:P27 family predicted phage terminase small subunit
MGKRGPPPKPSALKKAQGTYRKSRAPAKEIEPTPGAPECPEQLDEIGRAEWLRIVPELERVGVLTVVDRVALEGYCANYSLARQYQAEAEREPLVEVPIQTKGGDVHYVIKPNPAAGEARRHWALVKMFAAEFGLTPSARTRVGKPPGGSGSGDGAPKDPDEAFLFGAAKLKVMQGGKSEGGGNGGP